MRRRQKRDDGERIHTEEQTATGKGPVTDGLAPLPSQAHSSIHKKKRDALPILLPCWYKCGYINLYIPPKKDVKFFLPILGEIKTFTWAAEIAHVPGTVLVIPSS